nr:HD domain-containing phosphohydrolase [Sulfobacillus harzensis]
MRARQLLGANSPYEYPICTNLGLSYLELRQLDAARQWLEQAITVADGPAIRAVNGLARLALLEGQTDAMHRWGQAAFAAMWDGMTSFEPEEMAHLAEVLGRMAWRAGHGRLAVRLFDHAQSFYGRSGRWDRWAALNESIAEAEQQGDTVRTSPVLDELTRWTVLLENMAAQELVEPRASQLADIRLFIANRLADTMGLGFEDQKWLTYVCRLADLGLSVVGGAHDPREEMPPAAREVYEQHPAMSVQLLDRLGLPDVVTAAIADHHERWDGRGFPAGKAGDEIALLARIFATADWYARETTVNGRRHRAVLDDIQHAGGEALAPECVTALLTIFQAGDSLA